MTDAASEKADGCVTALSERSYRTPAHETEPSAASLSLINDRFVHHVMTKITSLQFKKSSEPQSHEHLCYNFLILEHLILKL